MFSLGIIFVIVITLFYVRQRLSDYDSKMSSILQVISGISNELNIIKTSVFDYKSKINKLETIKEEVDEDLDENVENPDKNDLRELSEDEDDEDEDDEDDEYDDEDDDDEDDDDNGDNNDEIREAEQTLKNSINDE
jgi:hypothetical protein